MSKAGFAFTMPVSRRHLLTGAAASAAAPALPGGLSLALSPLGAQIRGLLPLLDGCLLAEGALRDGTAEHAAAYRKTAAVCHRLHELSERHWRTPPRDLGHALTCAEIAHYWSDRAIDGSMTELESGGEFERASARLILSVLQLGGRQS